MKPLERRCSGCLQRSLQSNLHPQIPLFRIPPSGGTASLQCIPLLVELVVHLDHLPSQQSHAARTLRGGEALRPKRGMWHGRNMSHDTDEENEKWESLLDSGS